MLKPLNELTASEIAISVSSGQTTCEAVVRACIERIAERESDVEAWEHINFEMALAGAREFDRSGKGGPMAGVPVAVKDIIDTADLPTERGTEIHQGRRAGRDAACVALTRKAGGVVLGKTVTTKFPDMTPGKTRNPLDAERTPGGSSSGSAAAVADKMAPIALGTQTTGSTIRPASFCGVFGYRPTYGEHRLDGVLDVCGSLDTLGILARSIDDLALYRDVLLGVPPEPVATDAPAPRIGLCRTHLWGQVAPAVQTLIENAAEGLAHAGASLRETELPSHFAELTAAHRWISSFESARSFTWEIENHREMISETGLNGRIADGLSCPLDRYIGMLEFAERCRLEIAGIWDEVDVLLTAAATDEAPVGWDALRGAPFYTMWTVLHVPSVSVPGLHGQNGMPVGVQLFARRHADRRLFADARWVERNLR